MLDDEPRPPWPTGDRSLDPPVTVRTFTRGDERMPIDAFLRSEGIPTFLPDGNTLAIQPDLYIALGFFKLQVPTSLVPQAQQLLDDWDAAEPLADDAEFEPTPLPDNRPTADGFSLRQLTVWLVVAAIVLLVLILQNQERFTL